VDTSDLYHAGIPAALGSILVGEHEDGDVTKSTSKTAWSTELELVGAGGEAVDLKRTLLSHGFVELPPMRLEEDIPALEVTLSANGRSARTVEIRPGKQGRARVTLLGRPPSARAAEKLVTRIRHVLGLDKDLSEFYALAADDPDLYWATAGAGRMVRSPTVFEDVVKTI
jgi:hypothetical protein